MGGRRKQAVPKPYSSAQFDKFLERVNQHLLNRQVYFSAATVLSVGAGVNRMASWLDTGGYLMGSGPGTLMKIEAHGRVAANANVKRLRIGVGTIEVEWNPGTPLNGCNWRADGILCRPDPASLSLRVWFQSTDTTAANKSFYGSIGLAASGTELDTLKDEYYMDALGVADNDIVLTLFKLEQQESYV